MRVVLGLCAVFICISLLSSQEPSPSLKLSIGTPKSAVAAAFGKRFGPFSVAPGDDNALVGVPTGLWDVYHLTALPDRVYVTIVHFGTQSTSSSAQAQFVDSLMLMPADATTVDQVLKDQPAFASVCEAGCELVLVRNKAGNLALLLRPKNPRTNTVLYFDGDSAGRWKSVTSMKSIVSWAYALSRSDFEAHRKPVDDQVIGYWSPDIPGR
jgi:hypothetical protein